jgi:hypothetical protein
MNRTGSSVVAVLAFVALLCGALPARGQTAPSLGTAQSFAVLGGSTVTNTGTSTITGNLGVSPGSAVTGFPPGIVTGGIHTADAVALQAQSDVTTAYNSITSQPCTADLSGQNLGSMTLTPGVYCFSTSASLTGTLTLDGQGNAAAVFIFKIGSTLTTASSSTVSFIGNAASCNVFWQVGTSATLGTTSSFAGNILALTSITLTTGAQVLGRTLARNGAVTLDTNSVNASTCGGVICPTIALAPTTLPNGAVGVAYNQTLTASGGTAPYVFTVPIGAPPAGIALSNAGVLGGTPTTAGAPAFTVRATDTNTCFAERPYTLTIPGAVPTLPQWAMIVLACLLAVAGVTALRRRDISASRGGSGD